LIEPVLSGAENAVCSAVEGTADRILDLGLEGEVCKGEVMAEAERQSAFLEAVE